MNECVSQFRWVGADGDFGYPLEVSSSVFRLADLLPLLTAASYTNPNTLEEQMSKWKKLFQRKAPNLLCFPQSVSFCNPINRVQTVLDNRAGNTQEYSSQSLSELFEAGYRLDIQAYRDFLPTSCHQEVEVVIKKLKERIVAPG